MLFRDDELRTFLGQGRVCHSGKVKIYRMFLGRRKMISNGKSDSRKNTEQRLVNVSKSKKALT